MVSDPARRVLRPQPLNARAFAPFGTVIAWPGDAASQSVNAGTSQRTDLLADLGLTAAGGQPCLALFRAQARQFPLPLVELERHQLGAQLFIPLGCLRFVVAVTAAAAHNAPAEHDLRAFISDGSQGVSVAPGTWHHALIAVDAGDYVVIERRAALADCDVVPLARGADASPLLHLI